MLVESLAELAANHPDYRPTVPACDLCARGPDFDLRADEQLRATLAGTNVRMFHATRVLPHEVERIRSQGLRTLNAELRRDKLLAAYEHYPHLISMAEVELLLESGPLTWDDHASRRGQIWVVAPLRALHDAGGFDELFGCWGGESIAWAAHSVGADAVTCAGAIDRLTEASFPAVVEVRVEAVDLTSTRLWPVMAGHLLDQPDAHNEWRVENVSALPVLDIITPKDSRWSAKWVDADWSPRRPTAADAERDERVRQLVDAARIWLENDSER